MFYRYWTTKAPTKTPIPTALVIPGVAVVKDKIYVIGGIDAQNNFLNTVFEYDASTDTWATKAPMPTARYSMGAAVVKNKIYAIGGTFGGPVNIVEKYNPITDTWVGKASMSIKRVYLSADSVKHKIYVIGGLNGVLSEVNTVEEYTP